MLQTRLLIASPIRKQDQFENLSKYEQMVEIIQLYKGEQYKEWTDKVDEDCKFNLSQPLLTRNEESNLISVNFNPKLEAVLREVRYSGYIGENEIPESAAKLFERHDQASFKIRSESLIGSDIYPIKINFETIQSSVFGLLPFIRLFIGIIRSERLF